MFHSKSAARGNRHPANWQETHIEQLHANQTLPRIPPTITDVAGLEMHLGKETWRFNCGPDTSVITWRLKSPLLLESIQQYVMDRVKRVSARSAQNAGETITALLETCPSLDNVVHADSLESYTVFLVHAMNELAFNLRQEQRFWRYFYLSDWYKWCFRRCPELGFDSGFYDQLDSMKIPANPSGEAVRSGDPMKGPLDFELETKLLIAALLHDKSPRREHLQQKLAVALGLSFGRNSLSFRLLTEDDFIHGSNNTLPDSNVLRIPRIKKRRRYREVFTDEPIEEFLSDLIQQVIESNRTFCTTINVSQSHHEILTQLLRPLFMRETPRKELLASSDSAYAYFLSNSELLRLLRDFVERHQIYSPITNSLLNLSFRRLRYTVATDAALAGTSLRELALLLDQTGTQTARVYINASGKIVPILEQAAKGRIDSMLGFFETSDDSSKECLYQDGDDHRVTMPPLSCYRCPLFSPFNDCNHSPAIEMLDLQLRDISQS